MKEFTYEDLPSLKDVGLTKSLLFVDLETTGFQHEIPETCVLSVGAVFVNTDGEVVDEYYAVICPTDEQIANARPGALAVNGFTEEKMRAEGRPATEVWTEFGEWLKAVGVHPTKTRYVGQNPGFDLAFLSHEAPEIVKRYNWTDTRALDIIALYSTAESKYIVPFISHGRRGKNGNALAEKLGVEGEPEVHNALEGAKVAFRNFSRLAQVSKKWSDKQGKKIKQ